MFMFPTIAGAFAEATKAAERHDRQQAAKETPKNSRAVVPSLIAETAQWLGLRGIISDPPMPKAS